MLGAVSLTTVAALLVLGAGAPFRTSAQRAGADQPGADQPGADQPGADRRGAGPPAHATPLGAFLGSGAEGVERMEAFERWLGSPVDVGRTYLPGDGWEGIEGPPGILDPWTAWKRAHPEKLLVINVPMLPGNEDGAADGTVAAMLAEGAGGAYDRHFRELAGRLTRGGANDAVIIPGWEMNGGTYTSRCAPDPTAWRAYWRRVVAAMRSAPGARFRFDFTANRGRDTIPWPDCYPGDDVVDIIGSDNYDQPEGADFGQFISEPYGLDYQAEFAKKHKKPLSFPEWGMFRNSDNPTFVSEMHHWMTTHSVAYQSITDYCPHGVWGCAQNPRSSAEYRRLFGGRGAP
ncbi:glycosyl hydrolase family 26 [Actinomadura logoneensis]|uniref:Glycosyl hydrolase family 26 n=1 Tax=Actinomadura logoneensis TaxID=2293572 RepID=A0A372JJK2_9ACTN|nr:glycosyl hydrolase family 26 [Actinomadura logoneensis]